VTTTLERLASGPRPWLSVGAISADLLHLGRELDTLGSAGVELLHVDVMDGVFCPQLTVGTTFVKALRTPLLKDVHLMITDPLSKVAAFVDAGADLITFHVEGAFQPLQVLQVLAAATNANDPERGLIKGVALNPSTTVEALEPLLDAVDYVLVLAINPGWSGQRFLAATARRLETCRRLIADSGRQIVLGVDGGVTFDNVAAVAALGPDVIVSGSAIFDGGDPALNARRMMATMREAAPPTREASAARHAVEPRPAKGA